jgi:hypothetical protein
MNPYRLDVIGEEQQGNFTRLRQLLDDYERVLLGGHTSAKETAAASVIARDHFGLNV